MKSTRLQLCIALLAAVGAVFMLVLRGLPPREGVSQAAYFGDLDQVRRCVDWGVDVDATWGDEWPPLLYAIHGVDLGAEEDDGCPYAPPDRYRDIARYLVAHGADVNCVGLAGQTALHYACDESDAELVALLVSHGADVTSMNSAGQTPLHSACTAGSVEAVTLLLDGGAPMEARDFCGDTPLEYAAQEGHADIVDLLVRRGAALEQSRP